jgi:hypothetical protein
MLPRFDASGEFQEPYFLPENHAQLTADDVVRLDKIPPGKKLRVDHVQYVNETGLAGDGTNAFALKVLKNSDGAGTGTLVATVFNTDTNDDPAGAALAADTWVTASLTSTDADRVLSAGDTLDLFFDEDGTATLPPGRIVIRGRYV